MSNVCVGHVIRNTLISWSIRKCLCPSTLHTKSYGHVSMRACTPPDHLKSRTTQWIWELWEKWITWQVKAFDITHARRRHTHTCNAVDVLLMVGSGGSHELRGFSVERCFESCGQPVTMTTSYTQQALTTTPLSLSCIHDKHMFYISHQLLVGRNFDSLQWKHSPFRLDKLRLCP